MPFKAFPSSTAICLHILYVTNNRTEKKEKP